MWKITRYFKSAKNEAKLYNDTIDGACSENYKKEYEHLLVYKFRLLDYYDKVYAHGLCDDICNFLPFRNFYAGLANCYEIEYLINGKWERLW